MHGATSHVGKPNSGMMLVPPLGQNVHGAMTRENMQQRSGSELMQSGLGEWKLIFISRFPLLGRLKGMKLFSTADLKVRDHLQKPSFFLTTSPRNWTDTNVLELYSHKVQQQGIYLKV